MFKKILLVIAVSLTPILELRGAIPLGVALELNIWLVYLVSVIGNMIPVPLIILFIQAIFKWMKKHNILTSLIAKLEEKASKGAEKIYKYELLGLFILVAIPLPGTGAWTGALVSAMLGMKLKDAVPTIFAGVATAGLLMLIISYGFSALF